MPLEYFIYGSCCLLCCGCLSVLLDAWVAATADADSDSMLNQPRCGWDDVIVTHSCTPGTVQGMHALYQAPFARPLSLNQHSNRTAGWPANTNHTSPAVHWMQQ